MVPVVTSSHVPARLPLMAAMLLAMSGGQVLAQGMPASAPQPLAPQPFAPRGVSPSAVSPQAGAPVLLLPPAAQHQTSAVGNAPAGGSAASNTVQVPDLMTDSPAYCAKLGDRVGDMARGAKTSPEAAEMAREGQRLCETGKTRNGIQHLRRAYILLQDNRAER